MFISYKPKNVWLYEQMFIGRIVVVGTRIFDCLYERECCQNKHHTIRNTDNVYLNVYIYCQETKCPILFLSHIVIWIYNYGLYPEPYVINHKDGNKSNNTPGNLELITQSENIRHAYSTGLNKISDNARELSSLRMTGSQNVLAKLDDIKVREIRNLKQAGQSTVAIANKYDVSLKTITNILNGVSWKHVI